MSGDFALVEFQAVRFKAGSIVYQSLLEEFDAFSPESAWEEEDYARTIPVGEHRSTTGIPFMDTHRSSHAETKFFDNEGEFTLERGSHGPIRKPLKFRIAEPETDESFEKDPLIEVVKDFIGIKLSSRIGEGWTSEVGGFPTAFDCEEDAVGKHDTYIMGNEEMLLEEAERRLSQKHTGVEPAGIQFVGLYRFSGSSSYDGEYETEVVLEGFPTLADICYTMCNPPNKALDAIKKKVEDFKIKSDKNWW